MRILKREVWLLLGVAFSNIVSGQEKLYPKGYFRNPLNIPMEIVANFGELRNNHWHMGLDIRTQQRENLPVHAAAEGYVARVKIEPGGFGRAVYINHPAGYTTLYAHLNAFYPALESWVKEQQYLKESWAVELTVPPGLFPLERGQFFAYSGNTGGSAGPHVHFEIRDTKSDNCLNPLLFGFPLPDRVPPAISRLALYDRNRSVYSQSPQFVAIRKVGNSYGLAGSALLKTGKSRISFAIGATDRLSGSPNPNGIYSTQVFVNDELESAFILDNISYMQTRYLNAQIDYRYKYGGGAWLQHLSRMPGDVSSVYQDEDGFIDLSDGEVHPVRIEVYDAAGNLSQLKFQIQYDPRLANPLPAATSEAFAPNHINVFEEESFELFTTEHTVYDTVPVTYKLTSTASQTASPMYSLVGPSIPSHDSVTVRIKWDGPDDLKSKAVIQSIAGSRKVVQKAAWSGDWARASFRQFGAYQLLIDNQPPGINAPPPVVTKSSRIVFTPTDNLAAIKQFRAELDGKWLRFTNNGGRSWIYTIDDRFPPGQHELQVTVEDEAGNITTKVWNIRR